MDPLSSQLQSFLMTILIGLGIGFIYDMYFEFRRFLKVKNTGGHFWDLLFWVITTFFTYILLIIGNWGELRFYVIVGLIIGAFIYIKIIGKILTPLIVRLIALIVNAVKFLLRIIIYPFRLIGRIILVPLGFVGLICTKVKIALQRILWKAFGKPVTSVTRGFKRKYNNHKKSLIKKLIKILNKK